MLLPSPAYKIIGETFQLLQMPLKVIAPHFLHLMQPIQLQNIDPFHCLHQEGFKMLDLPDDMPAHGQTTCP